MYNQEFKHTEQHIYIPFLKQKEILKKVYYDH